MRGKALVLAALAVPLRITPAHAGKSLPPCRAPSPSQDHPRPCGEKLSPAPSTLIMPGSPPPMRGKVKGGRHIRILPRITPAHAGKSDVIASGKRVVGDHPRPCGEKCLPRLPTVGTIGSPPPMRGKVNADNVKQFVDRITPAHAGKRPERRLRRTDNGDHPRPCGEKRSELCDSIPE